MSEQMPGTMPLPAAPATTDDAAGPGPAAGERPEVLVGGAFLGGFLLALVLKRLGS